MADGAGAVARGGEGTGADLRGTEATGADAGGVKSNPGAFGVGGAASSCAISDSAAAIDGTPGAMLRASSRHCRASSKQPASAAISARNVRRSARLRRMRDSKLCHSPVLVCDTIPRDAVQDANPTTDYCQPAPEYFDRSTTAGRKRIFPRRLVYPACPANLTLHTHLKRRDRRVYLRRYISRSSRQTTSCSRACSPSGNANN